MAFFCALPLRGQGSSITVTCPDLSAVSGTVSCPVVLTLGSGVTIDSLTFGLTVAPGGDAPALTQGQLSWIDLVGGAFVTTGGTNNAISVLWYNLKPPLSGTVQLGFVGFTVPAGAAIAQSYAVSIPGASASLTEGSVNVSAGPSAATTLSSYSACDFGQTGTVNTSDVKQAINEALGTAPPIDDLNGDSKMNVVDIQIVLNAALGGACMAS
jgi:hypothetical protein